MNARIEAWVDEVRRRSGVTGTPASTVLVAVVVCLAVMAWAAWRWWPAADDPSISPSMGVESASIQQGAEDRLPLEADEGTESSRTVFVHVVGSVRAPGVYCLPESARVKDAVDAAGGMLADAAPERVNLARPVCDGEQIFVSSEGDAEQAVAAPGDAVGSGTASAAEVNVNTADSALLDTLPGIGPATAQKIVADRETNGPFSSVEDLARVPGIGAKKVEQLAALACAR